MITAQHPEWPEFKRRVLLTRIEDLRTELEAPLSEPETAMRRGEIAGLRKIIEAVEKPGIDTVTPSYT